MAAIEGEGEVGRERVGGVQELPAADPERGLWGNLADATTLDAYCRAWLALQCRMLPGITAGMVLLAAAEGGPYRPAAIWPDSRRSLKHLTPAAERALTERRGVLLRGNPEDSEPAGRDSCAVAYPIEVRQRLRGVVILEAAARPEPQLQAILRQLHWGAAGLESHFWREESAFEEASRKRLQLVLDLLAAPTGHARFAGAAMAFVTALATRLQCDRVSLGSLRRGRTRIRAVSHSADFKEQTSLLRAVAAAMDEAVDQQATVIYPPLPDRPLRVTRAHAELSRQHGAGAICTVPLPSGGQVVGTVTLERPADLPFDGPTLEVCEALAALAGPTLDTQRREDRWLLTKAADAAWRQAGALLGPRQLVLKLVVLAVVGAVTFLALAKGDYRVSAKSILEANVRRAAVAPFNGYIAEAPVRAGDLVRQGQALATLDNRELRLERLKALSQHEQLARQYQQALAARVAAQVNILAAQMDQAKAQLALLDDQLARTTVRAPFDGVVVLGDLSQALGSPVERGQVLFEVAPLDAYRVVLQVDERDIADVATGQAGQMLLTGFPEDPLAFRVEKVTPVSTAREGRNYFRVEGRLAQTPDRLRPGLEGVGKIEIDRRLLVWIWTRQVIDWARLALWTWMP